MNDHAIEAIRILCIVLFATSVQFYALITTMRSSITRSERILALILWCVAMILLQSIRR